MVRRLGISLLALATTVTSVIGLTSPAGAVGPPSVSVVSPNSGPLVGGTRVTVTGRGFTRAASVTFGQHVASRVQVLSSTRLQVIAPRGSSGSVDLRVRNSAGTSVRHPSDHFTYVAAPAVTSVSPASGVGAGGTRVAVTGARFIHVTSVRFGASLGTSV